MSIADQIVKNIKKDNQQCNQRERSDWDEDSLFDDCYFSPECFEDAPDIEIFLDREPDAGPYFAEEQEEQGDAVKPSVLGTYQPMASPGLITLYQRNIEAFWKSLLHQAYRHVRIITNKDAEHVLKLLVYSVYQHERFHFVCDFSRQLMGCHGYFPYHGPRDILLEEALAVAFEWHWIKEAYSWNNYLGLMHPSVRRIVIQAMFNHHSPGYSDWRLYMAKQDFHDAVSEHLLFPYCQSRLNHWGFNYGAWAINRIVDDKNPAWEERIA
jgi:hypothetical protein